MIQENAAFEFPTIENVSIFGESALTSTGMFPIITVFCRFEI